MPRQLPLVLSPRPEPNPRASADTNGWTAEFLEERFVSQPGFDPLGFFFITHRGETAGTAFAWVPPVAVGATSDSGESSGAGPVAGVVHFLCVHPRHRGIGVGRALLRLVLARLAQRGEEWVVVGLVATLVLVNMVNFKAF
jgi:ribosomal protein S18 acetylase RimI-like enzyme